MFTKSQFEYLCSVQGSDDWHRTCFVDVVKQYHVEPASDYVKSARLQQEEFDALMVILSKMTLDDVWHLQRALDELNQINYRIFEGSTNA